MSVDYYQTLGVPRNADEDTIKKAYKKLALKWHPDRNPDNKDQATETFKKIGEAYDVLGDAEKRKIYDQYGVDGLKASQQGADMSGAGGPHIFFTRSGGRGGQFVFHDAFDIFNMMFGGGGDDGMGFGGFSRSQQPRSQQRQQAQQRAPKKPVQDPPVTHELGLTLDELYAGCTKKMKIERTVMGEGGSRRESTILQIDIKPGYKEGTKITFERYGDENPNSIPADIIFIIKQKPHPIFRREGNDLYMKQTLTLQQSLCGFEITIPFLNGETRRLSSSNIITPGQTMAIAGSGMPNSKVASQKGNLIVTFDVKFPTSLTMEEKALLLRALPSN
ncbi:putative Chaperone protein DnaJ [Blattamonas nauphoetae]|uniref:Chaperone protein DnaJ n=1 Tax=Blattamonas nauphoetae TaxID=2049346 RepID=A0ABQ9WNM5_9EUKA|nr:putative Chaperone protein DnaJ [Blattamonas nauphoetae]